MKVAGISLERKPDEAAAMFAIVRLGHSVANNSHIARNKQYSVTMEGNDIVVTFPAGAWLK